MNEKLYEKLPTYLIDDIKSIRDYCRQYSDCSYCLLYNKVRKGCLFEVGAPAMWIRVLEEDFI